MKNNYFSQLLHGGDYNPDQWRHTPEVWEQDVELMVEAGVNCVSLGIFAWAALEPAEGEFDFGWMDRVVELLEQKSITINFATPGGARPAWMAKKYPEVLRVDAMGRRQLFGGRHNHCFTSPVFRSKCQTINRKLAQRYKSYPYHGVWHVNNEYSGDCHCGLCRSAFRNWLASRYKSLDQLNQAWWSAFWSKTFTAWDQIDPPTPLGETQLHGLNLDWLRFVTHQTIECFKAEAAPLREITPEIPITTNFMAPFTGLNYQAFARELDIVTWDSYPAYADRDSDIDQAVATSFTHEQRRAMLHKPFLLMECSPSATNWQPVGKLKRPGQHKLEVLQAIAHGSDSAMYFQWRKSQGSFEKFHGAVIDHWATTQNRVFKETAEVGQILKKLSGVTGSMPAVEVAVIFDYQNNWVIEDSAGPRNIGKNYLETCQAHYRPFWQAGVPVDVIDSDADFSNYRLVVAPMLSMIRPGVADRLNAFVRDGGVLVTTYLTGLVDQHDLCFQNGFPGPLRDLCGVWSEETDALDDGDVVSILPSDNNELGLSGSYSARDYCDLIHTDSAKVLATYGSEFYKGRPAVTVNEVDQGRVYHIASRNDVDFTSDIMMSLIRNLGLRRALGDVILPHNVSAAVRSNHKIEYIFLLNFNRTPTMIELKGMEMTDALTGEQKVRQIELPAYGSAVYQVIK